MPGLVVEPDVPGGDYDDRDDDDGYYDDDDGYDDDGYDDELDEAPEEWDGGADEDGYRLATRSGRTAGTGMSRSPGGPPLGSYESRRAALRPPRRRRTLQFVLPILALFAIAFAAVRLLGTGTGTGTGSGTRPAIKPGQRSSSPAGTASPTPRSTAASAAGSTVLAGFPAYPGQRTRDGGGVAVNAVSAVGGLELAVGSADGYPAIWRHGSGSSWSLAAGAASGVLDGRPGNQTLTAVTRGPAGWLAVGDVVSGASQHPVVVTSADGRSWQAADGAAAFGEPGQYTFGAAAGQADYVIVGERVNGHSVSAATWWSAGLGSWNQGNVGGPGSGQPSEMFAAAVGPERFIAVGADGSQPAVWTSSDGQEWAAADLSLPAGATKAALREVTVSGSRVVATGNAETDKGTEAFGEVSSDGGQTWQEIVLPTPGSQGAVSALAASGGGFVAVGQSDESGGPAAVVWTSADGKVWAPARAVPGPAGAQVQVVSGLTASGGKVVGVGVAVAKGEANPVVYTAPSR